MTAKTKTINLTENGIPYCVTLRNATISDDMRRSMLAAGALQNPLDDPAEQTVAVVIYPRCMACLVVGTIDGKDAKGLSPTEFVALPYEIGEAWLTAALELNPGWSLTPLTDVQEDEAKKKE